MRLSLDKLLAKPIKCGILRNMEHEAIRSPEIGQRPSFDAVLVHGYWLSQKGDTGPIKLSLRSRLSTRAAALLYDQGNGVGKIVLTAGKVWGENYPSLGELMAKELEEKYKVPKDRIILLDKAVNTNDEIDIFLKLAKDNNWNSLLDISSKRHSWTIPSLYPEVIKNQDANQHVEFRSTEQIITNKDKDRVKDLTKRLGRSKYELGYCLYEGSKKIIYMLGLQKMLKQKSDEERKGKNSVFFGDKLGFPMDDYKL